MDRWKDNKKSLTSWSAVNNFTLNCVTAREENQTGPAVSQSNICGNTTNNKNFITKYVRDFLYVRLTLNLKHSTLLHLPV